VIAAERGGDLVAAVDAVPVHGTLAARAGAQDAVSIMDLLTHHHSYVPADSPAPVLHRRPSGLDVLGSCGDPAASHVLGPDGYRWVADMLLPRYYALAVTDTAAGLTDPLMGAVLALSDQLVVTTTTSHESATLALDALRWLSAHGFGRLARGAVVAVNAHREGDPGVQPAELVDFFRDKARSTVVVPWDRHLAAGSAVHRDALAPATRTALLNLAAAAMAPLAARKTHRKPKS
jgi:MinD-like ATPase involved in chromosome partitioning or flagellar assembly